ncbi:hypothetical protein FSP39_023815 [Pinctada imbricata]|uniref:EMI domain-containing protein n=1 Tax=Pinctada imbricata TaxID=66713 RepID=A0AA88YV81_PINIB|nr:hypothetical protein FSP39_023815 [Pinctada imbricata]
MMRIVLLSGILCFCANGVVAPGKMQTTTNSLLRAGMPNVCPYRDVQMTLVNIPCVQAFTRLVKVWKPNCGGKKGNWCLGHERRTQYYRTYKQQYRPQYMTNYKCCHGWNQLPGQSGCLYSKY